MFYTQETRVNSSAGGIELSLQWVKNLSKNEENIKNFNDTIPSHPPHINSGYSKLSPKLYKVPRLVVSVNYMGPADQALLQVLMEIFSASQLFELSLFNCRGFLESICPALQLNQTSVTRCAMSRVELSTAEQELLLTLPPLQTFEVSGANQLPGISECIHVTILLVTVSHSWLRWMKHLDRKDLNIPTV